MNPVIVVPYRGSGRWREDGALRRRNWEFAERWWSELGIPICEGDGRAGEPFDVTRARNAALAGATEAHPEWDVALMIDADSFLKTHEQAHVALALAKSSGRYVVAHDELRYLSPIGSTFVQQGGSLEGANVDEIALSWETVFAFSRGLWEEIGGFDPRFRGFGHQVEAFFHAATTLAGDGHRIHGRCYHLWHPYSADQHNPDLEANRALVNRYWAASGDEPAMRELLAEYAVAV